jgi:hypothetical protein
MVPRSPRLSSLSRRLKFLRCFKDEKRNQDETLLSKGNELLIVDVSHSMRWVLLSVAIIFFAGSCCKVGCVYQSMILEFDGYDFRELDSTLIKKYEPGSNFSIVIDSIYRNSAVTGTGNGLISLTDFPDRVDLSKDYQVIVRVSSKTYSISGIEVDKFSCPCEAKKGRKVASYILDGVRHSGDMIRLER